VVRNSKVDQTNFVHTVILPKRKWSLHFGKKNEETVGDVGPIHVKASNFCFCWLHCILWITETLIRHQVRSYYSRKGKGKKSRLDEFTKVLCEITGSSSLKVCAPGSHGDDKKFGKVLGLDGNMVYKVLDNYQHFIQLCDA